MSETPSEADVAVDIHERRFTLPDVGFLAGVPDVSIRNWLARGILPDLGHKHWPSGRWFFSIADALLLAVMHDLCVRRGLDVGPAKAAMIAGLVVQSARENLAQPSDGYRRNLNVIIAWDEDGEMFGTTADIKHPGNYYPPVPATDAEEMYAPLRRTIIAIPASVMLRDLIVRTEHLSHRNGRAEAPTHV